MTDKAENKDNVLNFPLVNKPSFNGKLRDDLKSKAKLISGGEEEKAEEIIDGLEKVICAHLILFVRNIAFKAGQTLGKKVVE